MRIDRMIGTCAVMLLLPVVARADDKPAAAAKPAAPAAAKPAAAAPAAAAPAAPPTPAPAAELDAFMKGFDGNWKCETKFAPNAFGPGSPEMTTKSTVKIKKDLGGFWWRGEYELKKTKTMPGFKGYFFVGFDPGTKQALITGIDNMGGLASGSGPITGNSATFVEEGFMGGQKVKTREVMETKDKGAFHKFEVDFGKGYQPMGEDSCKK
ncbi:MAG TPA: APA family fibronectin-binding glycoprotein [Polyangia bacterium]|nr:APA family fibronectin-binding glycoprotein [Polyangia bacterium]